MSAHCIYFLWLPKGESAIFHRDILTRMSEEAKGLPEGVEIVRKLGRIPLSGVMIEKITEPEERDSQFEVRLRLEGLVTIGEGQTESVNLPDGGWVSGKRPEKIPVWVFLNAKVSWVRDIDGIPVYEIHSPSFSGTSERDDSVVRMEM